MDYTGKCSIKILVGIHGIEKELSVLVDTGFISGTGFGLKLPEDFARYAAFTGTGQVQVADGRSVNADSIPNAKILKIEDHDITEEVFLPALFLGGFGLIGMMFLQSCLLKLDGPNRVAKISF